jgi:hypothetical protein
VELGQAVPVPVDREARHHEANALQVPGDCPHIEIVVDLLTSLSFVDAQAGALELFDGLIQP